ncbi:UNVERIFIED_CONTAM: hypothetical protein Scaly_2733000 [Sesamum calycinum]|uniref:Reverse transcriptase zinc-binding domain-containing protein n=1 Tax=Sesamum calycinum TaxID=2727403 RepID=A0AAW2J1E6_9LAMI
MYNNFEKAMTQEFETSDMGLMSYYLRIEEKQQSDEIFISQEAYVMEIVKEFKMMEYNPVNTPIEFVVKLSNVDGVRKVDQLHFEILIGFHGAVVELIMNCVTSKLSVVHCRLVKQMAPYKGRNTPLDSREELAAILGVRIKSFYDKYLGLPACKEAIPTTNNLIQRKCNIEASCVTCGAYSEDIEHVFLECSYARQSWALAYLPWNIINHWGGSLMEWIENVRKGLDQSDFNLFAVIWWMFLNRRNKLVMEQRRESPLDTILSTKSFLHEFDSCII